MNSSLTANDFVAKPRTRTEFLNIVVSIAPAIARVIGATEQSNAFCTRVLPSDLAETGEGRWNGKAVDPLQVGRRDTGTLPT